MKIKLIIIFFIISLLSSIIQGCGILSTKKLNETNMDTVADLVNQEVYIWEGEEYTPYLVITDDYGGNALLLRKYLLDDDMCMNEYYAYYEDCKVDTYLNDVFYENLPTGVKETVLESRIEIVAEDYYSAEVKLKTISRKVFLLSYNELNQAPNYHSGKEGKGISYFKNATSFLASKENYEDCTSWWLRSVDTTYQSCYYAVGFNGKIGSTDAWRKNGIRPAFCIDNSTKIKENEDLFPDKKVYVIEKTQ